MSKSKNMTAITDIIALAIREAWLSGFTDALACKDGPGGIVAATAQPWRLLTPAARERFVAVADGLVAEIELGGAVLVPARVVAILEAVAAAAPPGAALGAGDARTVLARVSEMLDAGRTDLNEFKGKETCYERTSSRLLASSKFTATSTTGVR